MDAWVWMIVVVASAAAAWWIGSRSGRDAGAATARERDAALTSLEELRARLADVSAAAARLPDALSRAERSEAALAELQRDHQRVLSAQGGMSATLEGHVRRLEELGQRAADAERQRAALTAELMSLREAAATLRAERDAEVASHAQTKAFLDEAQTKLKSAFLEAASKVFDEKSLSLEQRIRESGDASRTALEATMKPFSERVGQFQARVEDFVVEHTKGFARFEGSVASVQQLNLEMAEATRSLANALKGNAKTRGDWGEMILETVLKASGLVEGANYRCQPASEDEDSGKRRFPDVVVQLPDDRRIVIDSKVSLVAWTEANNAATPEQYEDAMLRHTASVRQHIRDLEAKNYPKIVGSEAIDFTVMFVPIEGALSAALSYNADLQVEAFRKRIILASPNTLMAILRVVEQLWTRDKLQRTVQNIGTDAGRVLDALIDFLGEFDDIQRHIGKASDAFEKARGRLNDSPQSVINRTKRLVQAGAKGKKAIPEILQPDEGVEIVQVLGIDVASMPTDDVEDGAR